MDDDLEIECEEHGTSAAAVVCGHLVNNNGTPLGFIENSSEPKDLQGWCYACEHIYLQEEDRTDKFNAFCSMAMVCKQCYENIKNKHCVRT